MRSVFRYLVALVVLAASARAAQVDVRPVPPACTPCPDGARCVAPPCTPDRVCELAQRPCVTQVQGAQRVASHIRATFDGRIVRYEVEDRYVNRGMRPAEVDYLLPLPRGAAFENLELSINGEMIAGETMRAERARSVYEEIVRKLRDPALVEWMGLDLLRTRIFPVQPGEEKRVVVRFSAVVEREGDDLRLDWPARALAGAKTDDDWFELSYPDAAGGMQFGNAYSPTHTLTDDGGRRAPRVVRARDVGRPMTILIPARRGAAASLSMLTYAPAGEDGYALITMSPPVSDRATAGRDLTFVLDISGSMSGRKMAQARAACRQFLASLASGDRFRIVAFANEASEFRDGWTAADDQSIREAGQFVDGLRASGGTNLMGAIEMALAPDSPAERVPLILVITDGAPNVGESRPDAIAGRASDLRRRARVFTFGLGAEVNAALLEQLALQGRGTATFLRPDESVERAVGVVSQRLARPIATDVTMRLDGARLYAVQPQGPLDIFGGQDLVILARYRGSVERATLTMEGRGANGPVRWTQEVQLSARNGGNTFVARLWAVQRVGWLSAERRRSGPNAELDQELRELGERHGIPTELTSYLVVEPGMTGAQTRTPVPTDAPGAPSANGGGAFEAARMSAGQREAKSLGDVQSAAAPGRSPDLKLAGARSFRLTPDNIWADTRPTTATGRIRVKAYSDGYFALLRELPELAAFAAVGDNVRIEGRSVTIEITTGDGGLSALTAAQLATVVRDWR